MSEKCILCGKTQQALDNRTPSHTLVRLVASKFRDTDVLVYPVTAEEELVRKKRVLFPQQRPLLSPTPGVIAEVSIHSTCMSLVTKVRSGVMAEKSAAISLHRHLRQIDTKSL